MDEMLQKLKSLQLTLPEPPKPAGSYHPVVFAGNLAFLSGQLSRRQDGSLIIGKAGKDLTLAEAKAAAREAALNVLSVLNQFVGERKFKRILRITGYVQAASDFYEISAVMNGASDLFLEVLGEKGVHARSAVGMASLPLNAAVEIEATVELQE